MSEYKRWGDAAYQYVKQISGQHMYKKRRTVLALADAIYTGQSIVSVLSEDDTIGSKSAHYHWLNKDKAYAAAYAFLVGDEETPGIARNLRREEMEAQEVEAINRLGRARRELRMLSLNAVNALREALAAEGLIVDRDGGEHWYPDHSNRRLAANSILDRNPETAVNSKLSDADGNPLQTNVQVYIPNNGRDQNLQPQPDTDEGGDE